MARPQQNAGARVIDFVSDTQEITMMTVPKDIVERVRSEYLEMPGMRLTPPQLQRLFGIAPSLCDAVLESMVQSRFLAVRPDGTYMRASDGLPEPRMAKAASRQRERAIAS
jgi:hypothetical protein